MKLFNFLFKKKKLPIAKNQHYFENNAPQRIRCSHCGIFLDKERVNLLNKRIYCKTCYNYFNYDDDTPGGELTFITSFGQTYSGEEIYYVHNCKQLMAHKYIWHLDDGQEFTGWYDCTLEEVLTKIREKPGSFNKESEPIKLLYGFFGSEVDACLKRIEADNSNK